MPKAEDIFTDRICEDVQFGAFPSGVEEADGAGDGIGEIDGCAVGDVDTEQLMRNIGDESVGTEVGHGFLCSVFRNDSDALAVDLFRMMAGLDIRIFERDNVVVKRGEVSQSEIAVAEDIGTEDAGDPVRPESGKIGDWVL